MWSRWSFFGVFFHVHTSDTSAGFHASVSAPIHQMKNTLVSVCAAVENIRCLNSRSAGAWINKR